MSFWKFCEKLSTGYGLTDAIMSNIMLVYKMWAENKTIGEVANALVKMHASPLRPASALKAERESKDGDSLTRIAAGLKRAAENIEKAHKLGKTSCSDHPYPQEVVKHLETAGYRVKLHDACHCGDIDTHSIEWD